jgi:hypothetical protein
VNRSDITELHFITPIANVPSIMQHGILSHSQAKQVQHYSVAMPEIQEKRQNKQIPGAWLLHDYVNLYFDAHNPMLSKLREHNDSICVLCVASDVLDLPGVIVADRNAASDWVRFSAVEEGLRQISRERVFAQYWTHQGDPYEEMNHKSEKCAEVLVPNRVEVRFIVGAYVANQAALVGFKSLNLNLPVTIKSDIFF